MMSNTKALKLDSSFRPIDVIDAVEALVLCIIGKARVIENYNEEIRSVAESFKLPAVIVLNRYVKFRFSYVACNRSNVLWRDRNQCQYCANHFVSEKLTLDHVIPKSRGGDNSWLNLVTACKKCNQKKGNKTPAESGMRPLRKPFRPKASLLRSLSKEQISPIWKNYLWDFT
jgi:5-methylcytosine-specific restriction endonuclease McrA